MYRSIDYYIALHYQHIFGWEFFPGDSVGNFYNLGVTNAPVIEGYKKTSLVEQLKPPREADSDFMIYELPDASTYTKKEAKEFQMKRSNLYKKSNILDDSLILYMNPRVRQRKKVKSRAPVGALPLWADYRLLRSHGTSTGRITSGLDGVDLQYAVKFQCFAPDPFHSRALGGYDILTNYHRTVISSEESRTVASFLQGSEVYGHLFAKRYDQPLDFGDSDLWRYRDYCPDIATSTLKPPKRSLTNSTSSSCKKIVKKVRVTLDDREIIQKTIGIMQEQVFEEPVQEIITELSDNESDIFGSLRDEEEILAYDDYVDYLSDNLD
jgi:hypothetical protein